MEKMNYFKIAIGLLSLALILNPLVMIDLFSWFTLFEGGNALYYIFLAYFIIPIAIAIYTKNELVSYISVLNTLVLYFCIEFFNNYWNGDILLILIFLVAYFCIEIWIIGLVLKSKNFDVRGLSSFPNPLNLKQGYKWTYLKDIKNILGYRENNKNLFLDNFRINREVSNKKEVEKTMTFIEPLDTTKTILTIGKMGSGKTEFFNSVLAQNEEFEIYNREVIHDVKGDFTAKFYDVNTDFIFNPYDDRGFYWDIFEDMNESESLVMSFIVNLIEYHQKEKDFFSSSASKELTQMIIKTHFNHPDKSSSEKWVIFLNEIERYKKDCEANDDKTKSSIYANMELAIESFKLFAWQSAQSGIKRFSLKEFINSKGRLILLNNSSYSKKLYPLFTGFVAMLIELMLSKPDTKDDLTLLLLDEYLSLKFDEDVRLKLQTQIRSKGGCLFIGIQYIDMHDKKSKQLLDSSKYATLVFSVSDGETVQHLSTLFGNVIYEKHKESKSHSSGGKNSSHSTTKSIEDKTEPFITPKHIQSMPQFHHLTLIPEKEVFYLGYTPLVELENINEPFKKRDLTRYYEFLYNTTSKSIQESNKRYTFEDKKEIYLELVSINEDDEELEKKAYNDVLKKYNLHETNLKEFFEEVIAKEETA
ncbi:hypothetical protein CRU99_01770 [Malaciobacter mytili]|uniref:type IV secretory system conjugative DNA transfer family protein n=1 Tax=Malaciobacter mytili TaxID=603050 RepID=UPI00100C10FA|nr:type IV secretion system DNA-binding domain-containing protein [Malaciobacter mytili]RXI48012.1 hypothetical protein CRU99_01770 [Malaciobacter mytili]